MATAKTPAAPAAAAPAAAAPAKKKKRKLSATELAARITRDSAELAKRAATPKPKAKPAAKK